ncbi:hypothetical protein PS876_04105 [Pseudomonas fluorescens]|uniref:DUF4145 domain-containing protein n=1 Tax=Pseudomonas fluorescens TaxID=294 RepID=UPI001240B0F7|nr:DUF4145 domain-containing protein [Pseudomonas fluorescens]VVP26425.1 hypothetical protein PS876_04105 [Pseudomonas fluorescens]
MAFNWQCPFCGHNSTITNQNISGTNFKFGDNNKFEVDLMVTITSIVCPNPQCRDVTLKARFGRSGIVDGSYGVEEIFNDWTLRPDSLAMVFPDYVPSAIRQDYEEACKIRDLSPKASATLSRRCLQGIIRDFKGIVKKRLVDEIEALRDEVDPDTWAAIDAVRQIGNIGAHMEKDINEIIDVEPSEAQLLIELIETLIKDWYVARNKRQEHLAKIIAAADSKK